MSIRNSARSYGAVARAFHWATVVAVVTAWTLPHIGFALKAVGMGNWIGIHIAAGLLILLMLAGRLLWRAADPLPAPISTPLGIWGEVAAKLGHMTLYLLLLAVPVAGILTQFARGQALPIFGLFSIASPWVQDHDLARSIRGVHELLANAILIVAALHAAVALAHHFVFRDEVLRRMLGSGLRVPAPGE
jgi:cytochrome b561